jgi:hypothetical protein
MHTAAGEGSQNSTLLLDLLYQARLIQPWSLCSVFIIPASQYQLHPSFLIMGNTGYKREILHLVCISVFCLRDRPCDLCVFHWSGKADMQTGRGARDEKKGSLASEPHSVCAGNKAYADTFAPNYYSDDPPAPAELERVKYVKMLRIVNIPDIVPKVSFEPAYHFNHYCTCFLRAAVLTSNAQYQEASNVRC